MFEDMTPQQRAMFAMGMGLMGTKGSGGFGRAGLLGMQALDEAQKYELLKEEAKRREQDAKIQRELHELQKRQVEAAMREREALKAAWGEIGNRFRPQQSGPVPQMPAGPLNPDMSPVDAAMLSRNHAQSAAQPAGAFPFSWDEVLRIKAQTRGQIDLTGEYKDSVKTEEVKPGTYRQGIRGDREFVPAFDLERGLQGGPGGVQSIPGYDQMIASRELTKQRAGAQATAEMDLVPIVDPRPGSQTQGKQIMVPRSEAAALSRQANNFPQIGSPSPVQAPQAAPVPAPAQPQQRPMQAPPAASDRARILQDELAAETAKLQEFTSVSPANLKLKYGASFDPVGAVERTKNNIAALQREIGGAPQAPQGMAPPVSPDQAKVDREKAELASKATGKLASAHATFQNVQRVIDQALPKINSLTSGLIGERMKRVEGSQAFGLKTDLDTIAANQAFAALQEIRDNSPTGGALGQVAIQELELLKAKVASMNQGLNEQDLRKNLLQIRQWYDESLKRLQEAYKRDFGMVPTYELPQARGSASQTPIDALIDQYAPRR